MILTKILVPIFLYGLNCTQFGQLILWKITKTRCQILRLKCTKFNFGWGSAPDPAEEAYSAPPDTLGGFKGPTSKRREGMGKGREGGKGTNGIGEEGDEREEGRKGIAPAPFLKS